MELSVFAVDGYGDVLPERQIVGAAIVQKLKQVRDCGGVGQLDGVAIAAEEFFEQAEVEDVDSHLGMVPTRSEKRLVGLICD